MPHRPTLLFSALILAILAGPVRAAEPVVRVQVLDSTPSIRVTVEGPCRIFAGDDEALWKALDDFRWQLIQPTADGLRVGASTLTGSKASQVRIMPVEREMIFLNGVRHRGSVTILRQNADSLQINNDVPLERYLLGVVPREVDAKWPMATLEAQAIVARTFTLRQIQDRAGYPFDVTMKWPQLYGGLLGERLRATQAVEATRGLVVTAGGQLVVTYYHTVCGGRTEEADAVWPAAKSPALRSVECGYCRRAPQFRWTTILTADEVVRALAGAGVEVGPVTELATDLRNRSGRVTTVAVRGLDGSSTISALQLRAAIGPNRLRSTNFTARREEDRWVFDGVGWGHGVGLCQWGACTLGQRQQTARQILKLYYPGTEVATWPGY